ncbi:50S ribosomal protein L6 [Wolbachia pipientis]|uniref:50S ribosomal protein L6 n=1 Tax=Wolbachia pipientis TaxID=955 RepID=A0A1E7QIU0_WOLPI|nr:50S ribosomal protein L6 [Wolbachia pipientis]OEY86392.1 50S ribosomal protein L6 [Wolbachia pipientis]
MSRIGTAPINIPAGVSVECHDGSRVLIKSSKSEKELSLCSGITCEVACNRLVIRIGCDEQVDKLKPMWGTYRSIINNIINGMVNDFCIDLEINGVGYKAECDGKHLTLYLGYSHNIKYKIPDGIQIKCVKPTHLVISGMDKQKVYMIASDICKIRRYDPYKGKGVIIKGKFMLRKIVNKKK